MQTHWILVRQLLLLCALSISALMVDARASSDELSVLSLPIGETRQSVFADLQTQWGSQPGCEVVRTGVGLTRRAYFLENCTLVNTRRIKLYGETVDSATYRFLEGQLIQIAYVFGQVDNPVKFQRCAKLDSDLLKTRENSGNDNSKPTLGLSITDDFVLTVSDVILTEQVHILKSDKAVQ